MLAFGILGAVLVGLGIILIVAHNWDNLSRPFKNFLAFLPMLIGQAACAYTLWKKSESIVWRESASVFLVFAIGACIATISQIYNIQGELGSYLLTWLLLGLPITYVMKSSATNLLYIGGVIWFTLVSGFDGSYSPFLFIGLLLLAIPHYYRLWKLQPNSNFLHLHTWALAVAGLLVLAAWGQENGRWLLVAFMSVLAIYYFLGLQLFDRQQLRHNPFLIIGTIGTIGLFLFFSFRGNWNNLVADNWSIAGSYTTRDFWVAIVLSLIAIGFLIRHVSLKKRLSPIAFAFLLFIALFLIAIHEPVISIILSNIFVLMVGLYYIYQGSHQNNLSILNLGLITTSILIIARFLDIDLSFIARGLLFIIMGLGFFFANYRLIKNRD